MSTCNKQSRPKASRVLSLISLRALFWIPLPETYNNADWATACDSIRRTGSLSPTLWWIVCTGMCLWQLQTPVQTHNSWHPMQAKWLRQRTSVSGNYFPVAEEGNSDAAYVVSRQDQLGISFLGIRLQLCDLSSWAFQGDAYLFHHLWTSQQWLLPFNAVAVLVQAWTVMRSKSYKAWSCS